jgi:7-cyano-7-deazaguanine synthase
LIGLDKTGVINRAMESGVPLELTYTCYEGGEIACGKCGACIERRQAFENLGLKDFENYSI